MNDENQNGDSTPEKKRSFFRDSYGDVNPTAVGIAFVSVMILVFMAFAFVSEFYSIVDPVHEGLVVKGGELQEKSIPNGFYFKTPFWTRIDPVFIGALSTDDDAKKGEEGEFKEVSPFRGIQPLSKDGQVLDMDVQISYNVSDARKFYQKTGSTEPSKIEQLHFIPTIRKLIYNMASEYGWKALIQEGKRQEFGQRIYNAMTTGVSTRRICESENKIIDEKTGTEIIIEENCNIIDSDKVIKPEEFGIIITAINFKKIKPNQKIITAVETAQEKEQQVKIAKQESEIAKEKANRQIEEKRGSTESQKLQSEADAYKIRIEQEEKAKGEIALAEAEKARSIALKESTALVAYKRLEIDMIKAEALLEWARNPRPVPERITIIGTDEAKDMTMLMGISGVSMDPSK